MNWFPWANVARYAGPVFPSRGYDQEQEKQALASQAAALQAELEQIEKRLQDVNTQENE